MKRALLRRSFLSTSASLAAAAALTNRPTVAAASYTLRAGISTPPGHPTTLIASRFAAAVNKRTKGQLSIEVYVNGQLAPENALIDGLMTGVIDFTVTTSTVLIGTLPQFQVFDMPFIFKDTAAAYRVLNGPIMNDFNTALASKGLLSLAWGDSGFKEMETVSKPIAVPEDLRGIRMRVAGGAVTLTTFQALGAIPVAVDINEVYTAMTQHTIEACEIPLSSFASHKFYAAAKHIGMTNHGFQVLVLLGGRKKVDALPADLQAAVREEGPTVTPYWRSLIAKETANTVDVLKANGCTFTETQYAAFRAAVNPVYGTIQQRMGNDLIDRISRAANPGA